MVTLFKGGTNEKTLPIDEVHVPDLWHIAQKVRTGAYMEPDYRKMAYEKIIETWHIAAWLKEHIRKSQDMEASISDSELLEAVKGLLRLSWRDINLARRTREKDK
jgi:hypothetical protein